VEAAKQAVAGLLDALPDNAQVGLVSFNSAASVVAPLSPDPETVRRAAGRLRPNGGTAIGDGLAEALDQLDQRPSDAQGQRPPAAVILLSDGASNSGRVDPDEAAALAREAGVKVYTVGIGERGRAGDPPG
jgi:Ca-activated chloride channel family protein